MVSYKRYGSSPRVFMIRFRSLSENPTTCVAGQGLLVCLCLQSTPRITISSRCAAQDSAYPDVKVPGFDSGRSRIRSSAISLSLSLSLSRLSVCVVSRAPEVSKRHERPPTCGKELSLPLGDCFSLLYVVVYDMKGLSALHLLCTAHFFLSFISFLTYTTFYSFFYTSHYAPSYRVHVLTSISMYHIPTHISCVSLFLRCVLECV
jgi:hypothetical protein